MTKLFVLPIGGDLPASFGLKHLEGDLVAILAELRLQEGIGAYANLTEDQLAVLVEERIVLNSPELILVSELGAEYSNAMLLYTEFMDVVSVSALEDYLVQSGVLAPTEGKTRISEITGSNQSETPSKTGDFFNEAY